MAHVAAHNIISSFFCLVVVSVKRLFFTMPLDGLLCVLLVIPDHTHSWMDPEGGRWFGPPPHTHTHTHEKITKNKGSLSNTGPDPLNNHKATKTAFNLGPLSTHQRNAI